MKRPWWMVAVSGLLAACAAPRPSAPTVATAPASQASARVGALAAPPELLSKEIREAMELLTSEDPAARAAAIATLRRALDGDNYDRRLKEELLALVSATDSEVRGRALALLDFNQGLALFTAEAMTLADSDRREILAWAGTETGAPLAAHAFSPQRSTRTQAARDLGMVSSKQADWLLARLIEDPDREVALTAMDVAGDRKPSASLVDAMFNKAVTFGLRQYGIPIGPEIQTTSRRVVVHGHSTYVYNYSTTQGRMADGDVATEILLTWKDPQIARRLDKLFVDLAALPANATSTRYRILSSYNGTPSICLAQLIQVYHPKTLIPFAAGGAFTAANDSYDVNIGGNKFRGSSRLEAMAMLIAATDQDPADYGLVHVPQYGDRWLLAGGAAEEDVANKKLKEWWGKNSAKYLAPATQP